MWSRITFDSVGHQPATKKRSIMS